MRRANKHTGLVNCLISLQPHSLYLPSSLCPLEKTPCKIFLGHTRCKVVVVDWFGDKSNSSSVAQTMVVGQQMSSNSNVVQLFHSSV